jgi:hypothetical protein
LRFALDRQRLLRTLFEHRHEVLPGVKLSELIYKEKPSGDDARLRVLCGKLKSELSTFNESSPSQWICLIPNAKELGGYQLRFALREQSQREDLITQYVSHHHWPELLSLFTSLCNSGLREGNAHERFYAPLPAYPTRESYITDRTPLGLHVELPTSVYQLISAIPEKDYQLTTNLCRGFALLFPSSVYVDYRAGVFPSESRSEAWNRYGDEKTPQKYFAFNAADYENVSFWSSYEPVFPISDGTRTNLELKADSEYHQRLLFWVNPRGFIGFFNPAVYKAVPVLPSDEIFRPFDFLKGLNDYRVLLSGADSKGKQRASSKRGKRKSQPPTADV